MPKTVKLTPGLLRKLVAEEKKKFLAEKSEKAQSTSELLDAEKPEEVDADGYADTLEKKVDHLAALKIKEAKLVAALKTVRSMQKSIMESVRRS